MLLYITYGSSKVRTSTPCSFPAFQISDATTSTASSTYTYTDTNFGKPYNEPLYLVTAQI